MSFSSDLHAQHRGQFEAMRLPDQAGDLFQRHGAQRYLRQVLAKKDILKA